MVIDPRRADMKKPVIRFVVSAVECAILLGILVAASCHPYVPPIMKPDAGAVRVVGKIVDGSAPIFEPGEDPKKSYFVVTPAYIIYLGWIQQENREQALTIEKLRAIIEGKK